MENTFLRWHGNGDKPAGFQQRRRLFHDANRVRQVLQDLKQRYQIKCSTGLRGIQFVQ